GGRATAAALNGPWGVAVDGAGNVLITDSNHNRLRLVAAASGTFYGQQMTAGDIYTVAGDGTLGYGGDGGIATAAQLGAPCGVTVDGHGNPIVVDSYQGSTSAQN